VSNADRIRAVKKLSSKIDPLVEPLLPLISDDEAGRFVAQLIATHAEPTIIGVIRYKLHLPSHHVAGQADADDLRQEAVMQLLAALQQFRQRPEIHPISDLRGLAAVIAHRACSRWMRRQFPERHAFKSRLYYLLTRQNGFALWQDEERKMVAGFSVWRGRKKIAAEERFRQLPEDERLVAKIRRIAVGSRQYEAGTPAGGVAHGGVSDALAATFNYLGGPVEFDRLVSALADLLCVRDQPIESIDEDQGVIGLIDGSIPDPAWQAEKRIFLQRLWAEIGRLPVNQRAALLLNLKGAEGSGCIALFPATGVATFRQLAEILAMSAEDFAELWNELPLEDARIAELLQLTRQQVINLRKSARERLTRRLKGSF